MRYPPGCNIHAAEGTDAVSGEATDRRVVDIHRVFAEAVMLDEGKLIRLGRIGMTRDHLAAFARTLTHDDHVVVEATGNAAAVQEVLAPHVGCVVVANPRQVRLIAHAKIKTDKIDAAVLAKLHASGFLPEVWMPDEATETLRRLVAQRSQVVQQMTRIKNRIHGVLHTNLIPTYDGELFGASGRVWLGSLPL